MDFESEEIRSPEYGMRGSSDSKHLKSITVGIKEDNIPMG